MCGDGWVCILIVCVYCYVVFLLFVLLVLWVIVGMEVLDLSGDLMFVNGEFKIIVLCWRLVFVLLVRLIYSEIFRKLIKI